MRVRFLLVAISVGALGAGFGMQACGGTSDSSTPVDAGQDVHDSSVKDTFVPDVFDAAPPCDTNADLTKNIPDASIADGASTSGICVGCLKKACPQTLDKCNKNCTCQNLAAGALTCFVKTQKIACGAPFLSAGGETFAIGKELLGCVSMDCSDECAFSSFNPDGGDGGDGG